MKRFGFWPIVAFILLAVPLLMMAFPQPPAGNTGAPGDGTCGSCHNGVATGGSVTATAGKGSASVNWSAPTTGGPVTTYTVTPYIGSSAQTPTTVTGSTPFSISSANSYNRPRLSFVPLRTGLVGQFFPCKHNVGLRVISGSFLAPLRRLGGPGLGLVGETAADREEQTRLCFRGFC